ncbi:MAG: phosphate acyltransferase [Clostridia bacterium]
MLQLFQVAERKAPEALYKVKQILIFPDLDAGNIGYKLTQRFGHRSIWTFMPRCFKAVNDLSRVAQVRYCWSCSNNSSAGSKNKLGVTLDCK